MPFRSYIKIPRELFSSAEWSARRKFSRFEAMLDLLRSAAYADGFVVCCATRDVVLRRGQLLTTQRDLAERWGVSTATVNRYLQLWRNTRRNSIRIEIETTIETNKTLITICNYDEWDFSIRDGETLDETASETRHETQPETHIELNKNKNKLTTPYAPAREAENSEHSEQTRPADPKEKSCAKKEESTAFEKFRRWISDNTPNVGRMKEPFTEDEFVKLKQDFPLDRIQETLRAMHNWKPLLTKNVNANLTFRRWASKESIGTKLLPKTDTAREKLLNRLR